MRLPAWLRRAVRQGPGDARWIVLDVESSGMDPARDRLISIGAVALEAGRLRPADSFEVVLQQPSTSTRENILVHGLGAEAQSGGTAPREALQSFADFIDDAPLLAFHAPFDRAFLVRACELHGMQRPPNEWLDLDPLARSLLPRARLASLDEWLAHFDIPVANRHSAAADAYATALLALRLLDLARRAGDADFRSLQRSARDARWTS